MRGRIELVVGMQAVRDRNWMGNPIVGGAVAVPGQHAPVTVNVEIEKSYLPCFVQNAFEVHPQAENIIELIKLTARQELAAAREKAPVKM
jgi:hypothetical protein